MTNILGVYSTKTNFLTTLLKVYIHTNTQIYINIYELDYCQGYLSALLICTLICFTGITITLSDLFVFLSVHLLLKDLKQQFIVNKTIPRVIAWYKRLKTIIETKERMIKFLSLCIRPNNIYSSQLNQMKQSNNIELITLPELPLPQTCLYSQSKSNISLRTNVKNKDSSMLISIVDMMLPSLMEENKHFHQMLEWDTMPEAVRPEFGGLPKERILRKRQQISNVVNAVLSLVPDGHRK